MQKGADEIDYRETADVTRVHGAVKREHREPEEAGTIPVPLWLFAVVIGVTGLAFFYFGQFNGGFSGTVLNEREGLAVSAKTKGAAAAGEEVAKVETLAEQGKKVYSLNCASCHQPSGVGDSTRPPLAGSEWVVGSPKRLTMLVLKGIHGPLTVEGKVFNDAMPAWAGTLSDKKLAAVLSYIRSSWGNQAPEITPEQVAAIRAETASRSEPYVEADLKDVTGDIEAK